MIHVIRVIRGSLLLVLASMFLPYSVFVEARPASADPIPPILIDARLTPDLISDVQSVNSRIESWNSVETQLQQQKGGLDQEYAQLQQDLSQLQADEQAQDQRREEHDARRPTCPNPDPQPVCDTYDQEKQELDGERDALLQRQDEYNARSNDFNARYQQYDQQNDSHAQEAQSIAAQLRSLQQQVAAQLNNLAPGVPPSAVSQSARGGPGTYGPTSGNQGTTTNSWPDYQQRVTGVDPKYGYRLPDTSQKNGYRDFDGYQNGRLKEAKGYDPTNTNYFDASGNPTGFMNRVIITNDLNQAQAQWNIAQANGLGLDWYVRSQQLKDAYDFAFANAELDGINVIVLP